MTNSKKSNCLTSIAFPLLITLLVSACGGGGGGNGPTPPPSLANNVANIYVSSGGTINAPPNTPYVTITLCEPNNLNNCMTINNIMVDTGSVGLRVFAKPLGTAPLSSLNLVQQTVSGNPGDAPIAECYPFTQGSTWGPVKYATLLVGGDNNDGETASNFPIQVIADPGFSSIPTSCSQNTTRLLNDIASFGANGVLGVSLENFDCGEQCINGSFPNIYYNCNTNGANCIIQEQEPINQLPNPVMLFDTDNNGVIITLPVISDSGAEFVSGILTFGIDTQSNNTSLNTNTIFVDNNPSSTTFGYFDTTLNNDGSVYPFSFFDSGSNGLFFNPATPIAPCAVYKGFYCPGTTLSFNATVSGLPGSTSPTINFDIADASFLFNSSNTAFNNLGGGTDNLVFDWGLPFFYGRSVYVAIEGGVTNTGVGPYFGF
jgi:hypothetical protein